eukprot:GHVP01009987.1.p1 GENE.GHVP01009987.1~~GHVP01009987.1.p1  ORF type:complete len:298 (+),score=41.67 GHVP01009987.1:39-896(+)
MENEITNLAEIFVPGANPWRFDFEDFTTAQRESFDGRMPWDGRTKQHTYSRARANGEFQNETKRKAKARVAEYLEEADAADVSTIFLRVSPQATPQATDIEIRQAIASLPNPVTDEADAQANFAAAVYNPRNAAYVLAILRPQRIPLNSEVLGNYLKEYPKITTESKKEMWKQDKEGVYKTWNPVDALFKIVTKDCRELAFLTAKELGEMVLEGNEAPLIPGITYGAEVLGSTDSATTTAQRITNRAIMHIKVWKRVWKGIIERSQPQKITRPEPASEVSTSTAE